MVKRKERKMAEQYVEQLAATRERIVADRPDLADELAKPYERGRYESPMIAVSSGRRLWNPCSVVIA
jgi:hypothetical protein